MSFESGREPGQVERRLTGRDGLVLPMVILGLLVMSTMMIAAMLNADDEGRSARAMRQSSEAFYAAEAGLHAVYAGWDDIAGVDSLDPGETLTLDWVALGDGSSYQATIRRYDAGVQPLYQLEVAGRGRGSRGGQRLLTLTLTSGPGDPGAGLKLGVCCEGAATVRGGVNMDDQSGLSGFDTYPFSWDTVGVCQDSLYDKPGLVMKDTTRLNWSSSDAWVDGDPPIAQNPDLSDATMDSLGDLGWWDLRNMQTKYFDDGTFNPRPSTKVDPVTGETVCKTEDPLNLGSPDPTHPCFDYFPIVVVNDDVTFEPGGYAQGIFVLDWNESTNQGSEFDIGIDFTLAGLVLGKGCVEPEEGARIYGAIYVDGDYRNVDICGGDKDYDMNDNDPLVQYSTCAIDRAIKGANLEEWAEATIPGSPGGVQFLGARSFGERF